MKKPQSSSQQAPPMLPPVIQSEPSSDPQSVTNSLPPVDTSSNDMLSVQDQSVRSRTKSINEQLEVSALFIRSILSENT